MPSKYVRKTKRKDHTDFGYREDFFENHSTLRVCLEYAKKHNLTSLDVNTGYISFDLNMDNLHYLFASFSKLYHYCVVNKPEEMTYSGLIKDDDISIKIFPWVVGVLYKNQEIYGVRIMLFKYFVYEQYDIHI
jgi:hypothetical protein